MYFFTKKYMHSLNSFLQFSCGILFIKILDQEIRVCSKAVHLGFAVLQLTH